MKARDLIGKRVARVQQKRIQTSTGWKWDLQEIVFDDGSKLWLRAVELPDGSDYGIVGHLYPKARA